MSTGATLRPFAAAGLLFVLAAQSMSQVHTAPQVNRPGQTVSEEQPVKSDLRSMTEPLRAFDWDKEYVHVQRSIENVWQRNNWTDEADVFAREVAVGVSAIPPWAPLERVAFVVDCFGERYHATDALKLRVSMLLAREASGFLIRNRETIMSHEKEYLELRQAGRPITVEDVTRWAREGEPVLRDLHELIDRTFDEVRVQLSPEQQAILQRDFESYRKRRDEVDRAMKRWADGDWTPEEWGMEDDPIQGSRVATGNDAQPSAPQLDERGLTSPPAYSLVRTTAVLRCDEFAPITWTACAAERTERYGFDAGQRTTAESIVAELSAIALDYCKANRQRLAAVAPRDRQTDPGFEPIRLGFAELVERLDAIPTTAQRDRALESPPDRGVKRSTVHQSGQPIRSGSPE